jgi:transcriptional regulator with XRE-family HTH domain
VELHERIRSARGSRSQSWVAERMGVHQTTVSQWEKGTAIPRQSRLRELERLLDSDPGTLMEAAGYVAVYPDATPAAAAPDDAATHLLARYTRLSADHRAVVDDLVVGLLRAEGLEA